MITLYLIDDHQFIIDGVCRILEPFDHIKVIGQNTRASIAIEEILDLETPPDLIVCDLSMPELTGLDVIVKVRESNPNQKFLILTMHNEQEHVTSIAEAEAEGYVLKSGNPATFIEAIQRIFEGGTYYSAEIIRHLFSKRKQIGEENILENFTNRELEILKLILDEKTSQEIAEELFISKQTVDTHRKSILQKSGERTLIGLVKFGRRAGLITE